jgi:fructose-1,6-bisphosphatase II
VTTILGGENYSPDLVSAIAAATEAAAEASRPWLGRGDKVAADGAAVAAMRAKLAEAPFDGVVVVGEGEKDNAPMLAKGERLGTGGPAVDIAVDPLDGTSLVARGETGAICVLALAPRGTLLDPGDSFYLEKLVTTVPGLDLSNPVQRNILLLAKSLGKPPSDLVIVLLDKPRHAKLQKRIEGTGATVRLVGEGDVSAAVLAATPGSGVDALIGVGGSPEGVIAACAVRALGGFMQGILAEQSGAVRGRVLELDDLVRSDRVLFVSSEV